MQLAEGSPAAMKLIMAWFLKIFRYYVVFSKSIFFVLGLLFTYRFVEYAIFEILVTHLTDEWENPHLPKAVIIVNFKDGAYEVLQIFFAYIADAHSGLFPMLVSSVILYTIGLVLSTVAASLDQEGFLHIGIFYTALVLITLAQSAKRVTLKSFLGDQIPAKDETGTQEYEKERAISQANFWWRLVSSLAAFVAMVVSWLGYTFQLLSMASAVAMGVAFFWFLLGFKFYNLVKPARKPLRHVACMLYTAVTGGSDRAPIAVQDPENPGSNNNICTTCTAEQVMGAKSLLKMLPLWLTFLTFSLVAATGSTFFLEEATNIDDDFPVLFFIVLRGFTQFVVSGIFDYVIEKIGKKKKSIIVQRLILVRIGIGMICCVCCCIAAWKNAVHWLSLDKRGLVDVFRMVPQYLLLGAMEGLSGDGLESFFDSQVTRSISRYGPSFGESVMGVGKFLSVVCVLSSGKLFKNDIDDSRLDTYYVVLIVLSTTNLVVYCLVAYWYGYRRFPVEDYGEDIGQILEEVSVSEQPLQADNLPLSEIKTVTDQNQKAMSSSDPNDDEAERTNSDIRSGVANGTSDSSPLLSKVRTFPRMLSRRPSRRFNSMN